MRRLSGDTRLIFWLLAIVFGYDAICGEKERGTLRLMLSCSVPRDTVLLAKWIGGFHPDGIGSQLDRNVFEKVSVFIQRCLQLIDFYPGYPAFVGGNPPDG